LLKLINFFCAFHLPLTSLYIVKINISIISSVCRRIFN